MRFKIKKKKKALFLTKLVTCVRLINRIDFTFRMQLFKETHFVFAVKTELLHDKMK